MKTRAQPTSPAAARPKYAKPGRPAKAAHEARTETLAVRVTASERDRVQQQAERAGLALSTYCRRVLLKHTVQPAITETDAAALADLNRVGVNLNQIARQLNARGAVRPAALDTLLEELRGVVERLAARRS